MRIAFFTEVFLPKVDGIVTRMLRTLEELREAGHEALVFAPGDPPDEYAGHRVVRLSAIPFKPIYPELMLGIPSRRLRRECSAFAPDLIHAVNPFVTGLYGVGIARACGVPLVASYHTDVTQYTRRLRIPLLSKPTDLFTKAVHEQADLNLCTSRAMVDRLADGLGVHNVQLWPMGVDHQRFSPNHACPEMRARLSGGHPEAPLAVYVGRLSHEKNLAWLEQPLREVEGLRLAFVGGGPAERANCAKDLRWPPRRVPRLPPRRRTRRRLRQRRLPHLPLRHRDARLRRDRSDGLRPPRHRRAGGRPPRGHQPRGRRLPLRAGRPGPAHRPGAHPGHRHQASNEDGEGRATLDDRPRMGRGRPLDCAIATGASSPPAASARTNASLEIAQVLARDCEAPGASMGRVAPLPLEKSPH